MQQGQEAGLGRYRALPSAQTGQLKTPGVDSPSARGERCDSRMSAGWVWLGAVWRLCRVSVPCLSAAIRGWPAVLTLTDSSPIPPVSASATHGVLPVSLGPDCLQDLSPIPPILSHLNWLMSTETLCIGETTVVGSRETCILGHPVQPGAVIVGTRVLGRTAGREASPLAAALSLPESVKKAEC